MKQQLKEGDWENESRNFYRKSIWGNNRRKKIERMKDIASAMKDI